MCGDLGFYASELIHAIRGLKEQGTFDTIVDVVGAFGPVIISGIALWISWRSSKNTEAIQRQIATAEKRSFKRQKLFEIYSSFLEINALFDIDKEHIYAPRWAKQLSQKSKGTRIKMAQARNQLNLLLLDETSADAVNLMKAVDAALDAYRKLDKTVRTYIYSSKYKIIIAKALSSVTNDSEEDYFSQFQNVEEINPLYFKDIDDKVLKEILGLKEKYISAIDDKHFDVYFKNYLNKLS